MHLGKCTKSQPMALASSRFCTWTTSWYTCDLQTKKSSTLSGSKSNICAASVRPACSYPFSGASLQQFRKNCGTPRNTSRRPSGCCISIDLVAAVVFEYTALRSIGIKRSSQLSGGSCLFEVNVVQLICDSGSLANYLAEVERIYLSLVRIAAYRWVLVAALELRHGNSWTTKAANLSGTSDRV